MAQQDLSQTKEAIDAGAGTRSISYGALFFTFLKAGCLGFGGFMSLISVVESILVKKKNLLKDEDMLDGISLASLLPGPQAVNVVAYAGNKLKGTWGAVIAAFAVVLPSFLLMTLLSFLYQKYGDIPQVKQFFKGFVPAVAAVIVSVAWRMAKQNVKGWVEFVLVALSIVALIFIPKDFRLYITFLLVITFGVFGNFFFRDKKVVPVHVDRGKFPLQKIILVSIMVVALIFLLYLPVDQSEYNSLWNLCKTFGGLSVMLFGGGYVIIPMIQHHVVEVFQWLNAQAFKDGIAFSQIMPGPILIAAAFIGYQVKGFAGALLSTIAIFAPPAILMVVASQAMEYFKKSATAKAVMKGIRCGVIGMIFFAAYELAKLAIPAGEVTFSQIWPAIVIFAASLFVLIKYQVDVVYIIPTAGLIGYFLYPS
ncbi:MAG: chromate efflux transporter [Chitinophagales bacterium]|nr:chromate efflux transporter [Chitinophagales bacterium]